MASLEPRHECSYPNSDHATNIVIRHDHAVITMKIRHVDTEIPGDATMLSVFDHTGPINYSLDDGKLHVFNLPVNDPYLFVSFKTTQITWKYVIHHFYSQDGYSYHVSAKIKSGLEYSLARVILVNNLGDEFAFEGLLKGNTLLKLDQEFKSTEKDLLRTVVYIDCSPSFLVVRKLLTIKHTDLNLNILKYIHTKHVMIYNHVACSLVIVEVKNTLQKIEILFDYPRDPSTLNYWSKYSPSADQFILDMSAEMMVRLGGEKNILYMLGSYNPPHNSLVIKSNITRETECKDVISYSSFVGEKTPYILLESSIGSKILFIIKKC